METVPIIGAVLYVIFGVTLVVTIARETERSYPKLGDLPAALVTIFLIAAFCFAVDKVRGLHAKMAAMNGASLGYPAPPTTDERR
ncbi:MAG: hypothetical protein Q7R85_04565 [bacterium]|nr:hypothetical protein [bacterium]